MIVNYSTNSVKSQERFDYWKEVVSTHLIRAQATPKIVERFQGSLKFRSYAGIDIASQTTDLHTWKRTPQCIKKDNEDDYWLGFMQKGEGKLIQNGHTTIVGEGQIALYDAAKLFEYEYETQNMHIIRLPRVLIEQRAPNIASLAGSILDPKRPGVSSVRQMILEAVSEPFEKEVQGLTEGFADTLFDLIALSIKFQKVECAIRPYSEIYLRIMRYIRNNLADCNLSLSSIALDHHISTRTLSRLFAVHHQTPMNVVWHERLISSRNALTLSETKSVTEVAFANGFNDMSHFSKAFRKAFGYSPNIAFKRYR